MENYIAAVFPTQEEAGAANAALLELARQGRARLERAELYGRTADGELVGEGSDTRAGTLLDVAGLLRGTNEGSAIDLKAMLPLGMHALLAHVIESDPSPIDEAMRANGGIVYRLSVERIESSGI